MVINTGGLLHLSDRASVRKASSPKDLLVHDPADIMKLVLVSNSRYNGKESFAPGELRGLFSLNLLRQMSGV